MKLLFPCIDVVLSLLLFYFIAGNFSRYLSYALKILHKLISLLISILLLDSLVDSLPVDSSSGSF